MSTAQADTEHAGAGVRLYSWVAVILAILTVIEVAVLFVDVSAFATAVIAAIYAVMLAKFAMVAAYFMHLRFDSKWFSILFVVGMVMALGTYLALRAMFSTVPPLEGAKLRSAAVAETPEPAAPPPVAEAPAAASDASADLAAAAEPAAGPDLAAGKGHFNALGCGACHKVTGVEGAVGAVGPALDGLGARAGSRVAGLDADAYIRQSLLEPNAFVVEGYMKMMPAVAVSLSEAQLADLIAYLKSL